MFQVTAHDNCFLETMLLIHWFCNFDWFEFWSLFFNFFVLLTGLACWYICLESLFGLGKNATYAWSPSKMTTMKRPATCGCECKKFTQNVSDYSPQQLFFGKNLTYMHFLPSLEHERSLLFYPPYFLFTTIKKTWLDKTCFWWTPFILDITSLIRRLRRFFN